MTQGIYISTTSSGTGKSLVSLGLMHSLTRRTEKVGYFRPVASTNARSVDEDPMVGLMRENFELDASAARAGVSAEFARAMLRDGQTDELFAQLLEIYEDIAERVDVVVIEGTDFHEPDSAVELDFNSELALNFNAPVIAVVGAKELSVQQAVDAVELTRSTLAEDGMELLSIIVNRANPELVDEIATTVRPGAKNRKVYVIPELDELARPSVAEIANTLELTQTAGPAELDRDVSEVKAVSMEGGNFLEILKEGALVIVSGDRSDAVLATVASAQTPEFPVPSGMILTNGITPNAKMQQLYANAPFPVFTTEGDTFNTATEVAQVRSELSASQPRKTAAALGAWSSRVDGDELLDRVELNRPTVTTPIRFLHELISQAAEDRKAIVLPEGTDPRILRAAEIIRRREICDLVLLGDVDEINQVAAQEGVNLDGIKLVNPVTSPDLERYAQAYAEARAHRGVDIERARDAMTDGAYFGTMMVQLGDVDGMVSGAVGTTAHTIRPALEIVKTKPGVSIVSSVFFMLLPDRVLAYGDCAINPNPDSQQLADIAVASANTAAQFGVDPRVAMLSYSTGESGTGDDVTKVRTATELVRTNQPELKVDGPLQYDAAVSASVAASKMPDSEVAGQATVFIFPDLNTGNNTYKAVQQSAGALAVGPVLQGLNKPVNDLSRGTTVDDIVNTVAITAIQAQEVD